MLMKRWLRRGFGQLAGGQWSLTAAQRTTFFSFALNDIYTMIQIAFIKSVTHTTLVLVSW